MDAALEAATDEWHRRVLLVLRCTGLRCHHQALALRWDDLDFDRGTLTLRGELGKTSAEKRGRIMPVAPVLLRELGTWGVREGLILRGAEGRPLPKSTLLQRTRGAWERAGVDGLLWAKRPHHAFRKGFETSLIRMGVNYVTAEFLVGHQLPGMLDMYMDPTLAVDLEGAVGMVPEVGSVPMFRRRTEEG